MSKLAREFRDWGGSGNVFEFILSEAARVRSNRARAVAEMQADRVNQRKVEFAAAHQDDQKLPAKV